jgi:hypothetical protein
MLSKEYNAEVLKLPSWVTLIFDTGKLLFLQALDFRTASFSFGPVDNGSWRCWQAESVWHLGFQKKHAQFIGFCSRSKWSKHRTKSPFLALLAMAGSNAAYKIISACSNAVS